MTQEKWSRLSPTQKTGIWNRWKEGLARAAIDSASGSGARRGRAAGGRVTPSRRTTRRLKRAINHSLRLARSAGRAILYSGPEVPSRL